MVSEVQFLKPWLISEMVFMTPKLAETIVKKMEGSSNIHHTNATIEEMPSKT